MTPVVLDLEPPSSQALPIMLSKMQQLPLQLFAWKLRVLYEQWRKGPWLFSVFFGYYTTQLYGDYFIKHEIRIPIWTARIQWKVRDPVFFRGSHVPHISGPYLWIRSGDTQQPLQALPRWEVAGNLHDGFQASFCLETTTWIEMMGFGRWLFVFSGSFSPKNCMQDPIFTWKVHILLMATRNPKGSPPFGWCLKPLQKMGFQPPFPQLVSWTRISGWESRVCYFEMWISWNFIASKSPHFHLHVGMTWEQKKKPTDAVFAVFGWVLSSATKTRQVKLIQVWKSDDGKNELLMWLIWWSKPPYFDILFENVWDILMG